MSRKEAIHRSNNSQSTALDMLAQARRVRKRKSSPDDKTGLKALQPKNKAIKEVVKKPKDPRLDSIEDYCLARGKDEATIKKDRKSVV